MINFLTIFEIFGLYTNKAYLGFHNYYMTLRYKKKTMHNYFHIIPSVLIFFTALRDVVRTSLKRKRNITFFILTLRKQYFVEINSTVENLEKNNFFLKIHPVSFSKLHINYTNLDFMLILGEILPEDSFYLKTFKERMIPLFGICSPLSDASIYTYFFVFEKTFKNVYTLMLFCLQYIKTIAYYFLFHEITSGKTKYAVSTRYALKQTMTLFNFYNAFFVENTNKELQLKIVKNKKSKKNKKLWLRTIKVMKLSYLIDIYLQKTKIFRMHSRTRQLFLTKLNFRKTIYYALQKLKYNKILTTKARIQKNKEILNLFTKHAKRRYWMFILTQYLHRFPKLMALYKEKEKEQEKKKTQELEFIPFFIKKKKKKIDIKARFDALRKKKRERRRNAIIKLKKLSKISEKKLAIHSFLKNKYAYRPRKFRDKQKHSFFYRMHQLKKQYRRSKRARYARKKQQYFNKHGRYNKYNNRNSYKNKKLKPFYDPKKENPISNYYKNKHQTFNLFPMNPVTPKGFEKLKTIMKFGVVGASKIKEANTKILKSKAKAVKKKKSFIIKNKRFSFFKKLQYIKFSAKAKRKYYILPKIQNVSKKTLNLKVKESIFASILRNILKKNLKKKIAAFKMKSKPPETANNKLKKRRLFIRLFSSKKKKSTTKNQQKLKSKLKNIKHIRVVQKRVSKKKKVNQGSSKKKRPSSSKQKRINYKKNFKKV